MAVQRLCSIPNCGKPHYGRGLCSAHWQRMKRHGDPLVGRTADGEPCRYYNEVVLTYEGDECLIWPYANVKGYGLIRIDGRSHLVHRRTCEERNGPAPTSDHEAAHSCGKGHLGCVTKRHLSWKTPTENKADELIHGTRNRGGRNGSAKLTESDVLAIRALRGKVTQKNIAQQFCVSIWTVIDIHRGRCWGWLD